METLLEKITESWSEYSFLKADGFDEAVIGLDEATMRLIYSVTKCIGVLMRDPHNMSWCDAVEYF